MAERKTIGEQAPDWSISVEQETVADMLAKGQTAMEVAGKLYEPSTASMKLYVPLCTPTQGRSTDNSVIILSGSLLATNLKELHRVLMKLCNANCTIIQCKELLLDLFS